MSGTRGHPVAFLPSTQAFLDKSSSCTLHTFSNSCDFYLVLRSTDIEEQNDIYLIISQIIHLRMITYPSLSYSHQRIYCTSNGLYSPLMPDRELVRSVASGYFHLYSEVAQQRISLHMKYLTVTVFISGRLQGKVRESLKYLKAFQLHVLIFFRPKALQFRDHSVCLFSWESSLFFPTRVCYPRIIF